MKHETPLKNRVSRFQTLFSEHHTFTPLTISWSSNAAKAKDR